MERERHGKWIVTTGYLHVRNARGDEARRVATKMVAASALASVQ